MIESLSCADLLKLIIAIAATITGISMSVRKNPIISGVLLLGISGLLLFTSEYPIIIGGSPIVYCGFAIGLTIGLNFPCCSAKKSHSKSGILAFWIIALHSIMDGHIIREATSLGLLALLGVHKFMDGTDISMISDEAGRFTKLASRILIILVTPMGFLFIPGHIGNPIIHNTFLALVISFNLGSAFHLIRHRIKIHRHICHDN